MVSLIERVKNYRKLVAAGRIVPRQTRNGTLIAEKSLPSSNMHKLLEASLMQEFSKLFDGITQKQEDYMNYVAFSGFAGGKAPDVSDPEFTWLLGKNLIIQDTVESQSPDGVGVYLDHSYDMPIVVHYAWCCYGEAEHRAQQPINGSRVKRLTRTV